MGSKLCSEWTSASSSRLIQTHSIMGGGLSPASLPISPPAGFVPGREPVARIIHEYRRRTTRLQNVAGMDPGGHVSVRLMCVAVPGNRFSSIP